MLGRVAAWLSLAARRRHVRCYLSAILVDAGLIIIIIVVVVVVVIGGRLQSLSRCIT